MLLKNTGNIAELTEQFNLISKNQNQLQNG